MPKIRGVKPEYWTDEDVVELSIPARLLFIGLWNHACDNGHLQDKPKQIKMRVLPGDDVAIEDLIREIEDKGCIERADGWITIPNLTRHQKPDLRYFLTCDKAGCEDPPEKQAHRNARRANTGARGTNPPRTAGAHVDGDGDGEVMVRGSDGEPARRNTPRKKPATRLPDDWAPTEAHWERQRDGLDITREAATFRAHAEANDRRCVNWNAAFTQWLLKARPARQAPQQQPHKGRAAQWLELAQELPLGPTTDQPRQIGPTR